MSLWKDVQNVDESKKDHNQTVGEAVSAVLEQESVAEETTSQAVGAPSLSAQILEQEVDSRSPTSLAEAEIQIQSPHRENLHEDDEARTPELKPAWLHGPSMEGIHDQDRHRSLIHPVPLKSKSFRKNLRRLHLQMAMALKQKNVTRNSRDLKLKNVKRILRDLNPYQSRQSRIRMKRKFNQICRRAWHSHPAGHVHEVCHCFAGQLLQ